MEAHSTKVPWVAFAGAVFALYFAPVLSAFLVGAGVVYYLSISTSTKGLFDHVLPSSSSSTTITAKRPKPRTIEDVQLGLRAAGLEKCQLIVGIDYTKSNTWTGARSFGGRSLHALVDGVMNPYQTVIQTLGETLAVFDDDGQIPVFGFGDKTTQDRSVFPLNANDVAPELPGFDAILSCYAATTPSIRLDGPTSFAPIINRAMDLVLEGEHGTFTILVIITDGAVTDEEATREAIVRACNVPMTILVVGVGDGPWEAMEEFDNELPERAFDNLTFVAFDDVMRTYDGSLVVFAEEALRETPTQYKAVRDLGMLRARAPAPSKRKSITSRRIKKGRDY